MSKYKLTVTYEFDEENDIEGSAHALLQNLDTNSFPENKCTVALTREGDRSGANLLAPVSNGHYRHHKVSVKQYLDSKKKT